MAEWRRKEGRTERKKERKKEGEEKGQLDLVLCDSKLLWLHYV